MASNPAAAGRGKLHVLVERARELRNVEMIMKKMDVFVRVKFANSDAVTPVAKGMHKTPTWANPSPFEFSVRGQAGGGSAAPVLWVEALDKNYHNDALIGAGTLNVAAMLDKASTKEAPAFYEWVQLASAQGTSAGEVLLKVWFVPDAAPVVQQNVGVPTYQPGGVLPSRPPMHHGRPQPQQQQQQQQQFPATQEGSKWIVEYYDGVHDLAIEDTNLKTVVYMYGCTNTTLQVKGKINSIAIGRFLASLTRNLCAEYAPNH
ncbi:hypothetical protein AMAG_14526 [Allomyces macrogynus ATCC 38327]|uniref:C2 domain-containing protein n=1 Tax=Allomyces macrogynus (strain ATCC 38327) TaxID=578462 RepID=A0A0L0T6L7_ALLM3|nr:hypothetical protein AMAG_14526 [Allomyces macrogynus ATCC 38327]|eukprot:KNE70387.1 hypothetical protein AMAG_14526 [Allomyces macrogynus ATCC 38327]